MLNLLSETGFWFVANYVLTCKECDLVFDAYQLKVQCVTFTGMKWTGFDEARCSWEETIKHVALPNPNPEQCSCTLKKTKQKNINYYNLCFP